MTATDEAEGEEAEEGEGEVEVLFDAEAPGRAEAGHAEVVLEKEEVVGADGIVAEVEVEESEKGEGGEIGRERAEPARGPEGPESEGAWGFVGVGLARR